MLLAYDKVDKPRCAAGVVSYKRAATIRTILHKIKGLILSAGKIPVLSGAIPALINVEKSGPNHPKSLMFFEVALLPYNGVVSAAWRLLFGDNRMPTPTAMPADVCHWGAASWALALA
jgi:hypothetical protein